MVTCASYPAREFGVHAGMPLRTAARKCPDATFLPSDTAAYDDASEEVMGLLRDLGHPVEVWGWDEAYLGADVRSTRSNWPSGSARSSPPRPACRARSASATTSSAPRSPPGSASRPGIFTLTDANWMAVMGDREVDALWGVGPKTAKKLAGMGITTVADLAATDADRAHVDVRADDRAVDSAAGQGRRRHQQSAPQPWVPRSRSHVVTFPRDLTDRAEIDSAVVELARRTLAEIVDQGRVVTRVAVTVRTKTFFTRTKIRKLPVAGTDEQVITATALDLLTSSNSTARSGCSASASSWPRRTRKRRDCGEIVQSADFCDLSAVWAGTDSGFVGRSALVNTTFARRIATL